MIFGVRRPVTTLAAGLLVFLTAAPAEAAFCLEPRAPSLTFLTKPSKPYCATVGDGCDEWEIRMYRSQVDRYINQLQQYLDDVEKYRKKAYEYAQCMAKPD
jgi:hypothetical protein